MKILIVENDLLLAHTLLRLFEDEHYVAKQVHTLERAFAILDTETFDVVILDRVLPDGEGLTLLETLGDSLTSLKILVLSDKGSIEDKITGFKVGIDDYLAKPFSSVELLYRVKSLLAKNKILNTTWFEWKDGRYNSQTGQLILSTVALQLRRRESQIFYCLLKNRNAVVSRQQLINDVWQAQSTIPTYSTIDVYIRRLRMKLKKTAVCIRTVRGFGYRLLLDK